MPPSGNSDFAGIMLGEELSLSIMITTRNRVSDLRRTIEVLNTLDPQPNEIQITADGCTDDTVTFVKSILPNSRLFINEQGRGSVASRDSMLRMATSDLILSLDDDSYPEQHDCVARLRELFASEPQLAVAHFPQRTNEYPESLKKTEFGSAKLTGSYANSGACYRRSTYLNLHGFEERFFHMYEEPDYALQCIASGNHVLYWTGIVIRHHYSLVGRDEISIHQRHARNELWSVIMRCPMPLVLFVAPYRIISQAMYAFSRGFQWAIREPEWWVAALKGIASILSRRSPVATDSYLRWLKLLRNPIEFRMP